MKITINRHILTTIALHIAVFTSVSIAAVAALGLAHTWSSFSFSFMVVWTAIGAVVWLLEFVPRREG